MLTLVEVIASERDIDGGKAETVRRAFLCLLAGLVLVAMQASILAGKVVFG